MKSIAYIIGDFYMGGIPNFLRTLARHLQGEFNFHFIATDNSNIHPEFHNLGKATYLGQKWDKITKYLSENKIDLVQYGNKLQYKQCAIKAGVPVIVERTAGPRSCKLDRSGITHVISSTKGTVPLIQSNYKGQISIIYNGLDLNRFKSIQPNRLHFKPDDIVVCYCARMGGVGQGFEILLQAILQARKTHDIKLVLIGDKPEHSAEDIRPKLRKLAKPMGEDCVFTGALDNPLPVMAGADIYVCPARHHGISNSILEACALKKPIIATNVGQTNEIVHNGHNGYLVPVNDIDAIKECIIKLADMPKQRARMGHFSLGVVQREFNIEIQARKYRELYNKLLGEA